MTKRRYIINFVVIIVLGVVSGFFIGSYIAGSKLVALTNSYNELVLRGISEESESTPVYYNQLPQTYFDSLSVATSGKTPDNVTAINAFLMAEHNTNTSEYVSKLITGNIAAKTTVMSVDQQLLSTKVKQDGIITLEKVSYSKMAKVAVKVQHTVGSDKYLQFKGSANDDLTASWDAPAERNIADYRKEWGSGVDYFCNYLVTPKTVLVSNCSQIKQVNKTKDNKYYMDGLNYYQFTMALDIRVDETTGDFVYGAVSNYMYEIKNTAGAENFPVFSYCTLTVTIDSLYRLVQIDIDENYQIVAMGFNANTTGKQTEKFSYVQA